MSVDQSNSPVAPEGHQENVFAEFLDDYFAESDAHMTNARRHLLALESYIDSDKIELGLVEELLRSFHTIKGLSGMVGIREAEALAHEMESYLRALREEKTKLSGEGMDALMAGTQMLQQAIASRKEETPPPDIKATIAQLQAILPPSEEKTLAARDGGPREDGEMGSRGAREQGSKGAGEPGSVGSVGSNLPPLPPLPLPPSPPAPSPPNLTLNNAEQEKLLAAKSKNQTLWHFQFTPNAELSNKGINVNTIRSRLQQLGEIIHASPRMEPGGSIVFDFILSRPGDTTQTDFDPSAKEIITTSGLSYTPFASPVPPAPVPPSPPPPSPPQGESTEAKESGSLSVMPANVVRVDLARLDELMQTLGELVISRARLEDRLKQLQDTVAEKHLRPLKETNQQMERQLRELRAGMLRVRLVPISDIFSRMQFAIRDVARTSGKKVKVELRGQDTEIDKFVVERLMDPLLHLVRNAVSHGLETPIQREAKGKPSEGKVILRAATVGEMAVVEVEDDGQGIDAAEIIAKGKQMGILSPEGLADGRRTSPLEYLPKGGSSLLLDILCTSGFSTRASADFTSGRGVGLAVVRRCVQELGGSMTLDSQVGVKTKFRIQLPLTLAIADALLATASQQTFAVPLSAVQEIIEVRSQDVTVIPNASVSKGGRGDASNAPVSKGGRLDASNASGEIIYHRGTILPLLRLVNFFNLPGSSGSYQHAFIVGFGGEANRLGIVVDRVIGQREIVVRPLTDELVNVPGISGATDLGDGRVVLILDANELIQLTIDN